MSDPTTEERIRQLRRRVEQDSTSPLFVGLAEEYRTAGRLPEAIRALEKGLHVHPHYVTAQVALARAYLESGRTDDAIGMFTKALVSDPGNLVSARSLAEIHRSRGDRVEAIKKYKLYRALSGDPDVDEVIDRLQAELGPMPDSEASGRVLADLYFSQGHFADAAAIYGDLERANPGDGELARLRADAEARLEGASPAVSSDRERGTQRRGARVQALKRWLRVIQGQ